MTLCGCCKGRGLVQLSLRDWQKNGIQFVQTCIERSIARQLYVELSNTILPGVSRVRGSILSEFHDVSMIQKRDCFAIHNWNVVYERYRPVQTTGRKGALDCFEIWQKRSV